MENTFENKARFMAQYWGQKVFKFRDGQMKPQKVGSTYMTKYGIKNRYLLLKPLSSITDEDAEVIARIDNPLDEKGFFVFSSKEGAISFGRNNVYLSINSTKIYQYLQSKGYALPYMGLSVEKLIEYGWIKLNV